MPRLISRYVLREIIPPSIVGLLLVVFVLLMNQILLLAELFINKGVPALQALRILALLLPSILAFALPMAVLMGILGGLARLSADSEVVAFQSLGVGPRRLGRPVLFFGLCGFLLSLPLALYLGPRANNAWVQAMTDSVLARVRLKVEPLEFNESLPGMVLFVREAGREGSWRDIFVFMGRDPSRPRLVMARSGTINFFPEKRRAILELAHGLVYSGPLSEAGEDTVTSFESLEEEIDIEGLFPAVSSEKRVREKDIGELVKDLAALEADRAGLRPSRQVRVHRLEIHKKFALPAACLVFALLGLPLGLVAGRGGRTGGFSLGLVIILLYYVLITSGEKAAMEGSVPASLGMWGPDILLGAVGALLFLRAGRGTPRLRRPPAGLPESGSGAKSAPLARESSPPWGRASFRQLPWRFPGLLDRYVLRKFLALLALVLSALAAAALLAAFFERLGDALEHHKPVGLLVRYVLLKLPEFLPFLLPAAVLAAALLALGFLARTNETTAMKTCGISAFRTIMPVLVLAAAIGGLAFLIQERVVPPAHARAEEVRNEIDDLPPRSDSYLNRHWILGRGGTRIYHYEYFEPASATFGRLSVFDIDAGRWALASRFFAEKAAFVVDELVYGRGLTRVFAASPGPAFVRSAAGRFPASTDKEALLKPWKDPLQMTFGELRSYTAEVRDMGFPAVRLRAELAQKTALPFASLIMALIAVPFGFWMGRKGTLVGVGLSLAVAMAYWGAYAIFRSLGGAGVLPPLLGAWGANLLFGLAGVIGLSRLRT